MVSIIIPVFNSQNTIKEAIYSVLSQTYSNFEILIIDDNSSDNSLDIINELSEKDKRIKIISLSENKGVANARNLGLKNATGEFIAFLDSDDKWYPNKLEAQIHFMKANNYDFTFTSYNKFNQDGKILNLMRCPYKIDNHKLLKTCYPGCLTVMIKRNILQNLYFPLNTKREDYAFWLKVIKRTKFAYGLDLELAQYRLHSGQSSNKKNQMAFETWKLYRNIEKLNIFLSIFYFLNYSTRAVLRTYVVKIKSNFII